MKEIYILILEQEDYSRIYGVFDNYIEAEQTKLNLLKFNEMCKYGELRIYNYETNKLYMEENQNYIK